MLRSTMESGRRVLVAYEDEALWHERYLLRKVAGTAASWCIITPDDDVYIEDFNKTAGVRVVAENGGLPRGVPRGSAYRFAREFTGPELVRLRKEAEDYLALMGRAPAVAEEAAGEKKKQNK